ncbi:MAG: AAA-like domain-containing protein [Proteobacteria bacterium]|nr:AAA-like domain-containing protein [Pseudomonadota bacterium]
MVDIHERLEIIAQMVGRGDYFCINAGRQYGKTTTLYALKQALAADYEVFSISFEGLADSSYATEANLAFAILEQFYMASMKKNNSVSAAVMELVSKAFDKYESSLRIELSTFSMLIIRMCHAATRPIVLIIDEVDQASNHDSFIRILGLLRAKFLEREDIPTFQSVILAGVYDIKNLKLKIRPDTEHQYNSPWNIAARFDVDMSLPANGIEGMIAEYKSDHVGVPEVDIMDAHEMAQLLYDYTSGYPFLVSRICQILDEKKLRWDKDGFLEAEKELLHERNTLFYDMVKKLNDFPEMRQMFKEILLNGRKFTFNRLEKHIQMASLFNFITESDKAVKISNRIFETVLYDLFISEDEMNNLTSALSKEGSIDKKQFIQNGQIDMEHLLSRFAVHFNDIYGREDGKFVEEKGRKLFLLYLKPIINGVGNYYIEAQTRDETRTDIIIDYLGHQYIIELKIWLGNAYNERGEEQIAGYLDFYHAKKGYLVSFCFNKNKESGVKTIQVGDREIVECVV